MFIGISSDALEIFGDEVRALHGALLKSKSAEVKDPSIIAKASQLARTWLQHSQQLRERSIVGVAILEKYDESMTQILNATKLRTRASSYRTKLQPFLASFNDEVVIPSIKFEGNPEQAASRQIYTTLAPQLSPDEQSYIEEAVKCASMKCYRATIVLLWAAAIARMHRAIERAGFDAFNAAVKKATAKKGHPYNKLQKIEIGSLPELQRARDFDLLVSGMELWGFDMQAFQELERLLGIRNTAAHPGMYQPTSLDIQQFATKLDDYIFSKISA